MKRIAILILPVLLANLAGCSPVGMAVGAGAAVGVASQTDEGIGGTATDLRIKIRISDLWFRYSVEAFAKLNLTVKGGRVLITGIVQNPDQRVEAVRLAWQIDGVKQVINEIRVADSEGLPGYALDKWITARLRATMTFDAGVYSINYSIDTVQGNVYLMGVARSQAELDRVIEIARTIPHVKQVVSYITLSGQGEQSPDSGSVTNTADIPARAGGAATVKTTTTTTTTTETVPHPPAAASSSLMPAPVSAAPLPP